MTLKNIPIENLITRPMHLWDIQSLLLTSGDFEKKQFNSMTIGWGSIGYIWRRPFIQVVVRPTRYTYEFMEKFPTFTVCAFPEKYHHVLQVLGTKSGREMDKINAAGITPEASTMIAAPAYSEAELILECRKVYWDDVDPGHFLDAQINANYPGKDYHRIYFGEILYINGVEKYLYS